MSKAPRTDSLSVLLLGAIGVVYGDIGTSPLYALKSCFHMGNIPPTFLNVMGLISLFIWSLILVVSFKYVQLVLRMSHKGEGGILVLSSLVASRGRFRSAALFLGLLGASLFFGDGIITPAISVLSAVEGLTTLTPQLSPYIIPVTIGVLTVLFGIQKFGTAHIGRYFGPIMVLWFSVLFAMGVFQIIESPTILMAINPYYAFYFLASHGVMGFSIIGGVILVVTGAEALYADLGHFGRRPIALSWTALIFPALVVNYLGQGALLLCDPDAVSNPFYLMAPAWSLKPLIILATCATVIASQSILTGLFSITYHAILLNYLPRLPVHNTSDTHIGQIYVPAINYIIYFLTISAILKFQSSEHLAFAYGLSVAAIMLITTTLIFMLAIDRLHWSKARMATIFIPLITLDALFVVTNLIKLFEGAWYALGIAGLFFYLMHVWRAGNEALHKQKMVIRSTVKKFIDKQKEKHTHRIPGTALFFCQKPNKVPSSLVMNLKHNKYMHDKMILVIFQTTERPYQPSKDRFKYEVLTREMSQIIMKSGFREIPTIAKVIHHLREIDVLEPEEDFSVFISKASPTRSNHSALSPFSENLYIFLASLSQNAAEFYRIPSHKVIEFGMKYKI